jgi:hypothetical protein
MSGEYLNGRNRAKALSNFTRQISDAFMTDDDTRIGAADERLANTPQTHEREIALIYQLIGQSEFDIVRLGAARNIRTYVEHNPEAAAVLIYNLLRDNNKSIGAQAYESLSDMQYEAQYDKSMSDKMDLVDLTLRRLSEEAA